MPVEGAGVAPPTSASIARRTPSRGGLAPASALPSGARLGRAAGEERQGDAERDGVADVTRWPSEVLLRAAGTDGVADGGVTPLPLESEPLDVCGGGLQGGRRVWATCIA